MKSALGYQRPDSWGFAMDFLGEPESTEVEVYVSSLEARITELEKKLNTEIMAIDWESLHRRFMAASEIIGQGKNSILSLRITFDWDLDIWVYMYTYDSPGLHLNQSLGPYKNESAAFAAAELKISEVEKIVSDELNKVIQD